ncbi:uncharacterized protein LOC113749164 [Coffea eugenioides]|uniref:uncharacterized protein LOC113749164 n=1 Tax=Coffea eugenioides TaxID=49369 RepID=UPI000F60D5FF|nr:uncharacterized protein LOC113749164 [Coffea eugenioides]
MTRLNFLALRDLHDSANDSLHSPITKRSIAGHKQEKWVHEISEASLRMLETCGNTRDVLLFAKDHLHDLQSAFRRRVSIADSSAAGAANKFSGYSLERKKLKKAMLRRLHSLKEMKNKCIHSSSSSSSSDVSSSLNQNLVAVVNVLRQVRMATMAIVESLMSLMSMPNAKRHSKSNRGFFEARLSRVDSLSSWWENCDTSMLQEASKRMQAWRWPLMILKKSWTAFSSV